MAKTLTAFWLIMAMVAGIASARAEPPRLALVIANAHYAALPAIDGCGASGTAVGAALRSTGWTVTELRDPSNGQVGAAISVFAGALASQPDTAALLYFCGYAGAYDARAFLLPASARLARPTDILTDGIVTPSLTGSISRAAIRSGLVVLDLIALPGTPPPPLDAVAFRARTDTKGLFATLDKAAASAPSATAGTLATLLARPSLTVDEALAGLKQAASTAAASLAQPPESIAWLQGAPPAPPPAPPAPATQLTTPDPVPAATPSAPTPSAPTPEPTPPSASATPAPAPSAGTAEMPDVNTPSDLGDLDRRRVQLALQRLGYYAGKVDGQFGPESLAAIRRYQHELGADMTGRLTKGQAARLLAQS